MMSRDLTVENVKSLIGENKDVRSERIINGYYVRTIVCQYHSNGEIILKVLAVYERKGDDKIVQYNVDVENLFGVLLDSTACTPDDIDFVAQKFIEYLNMGKR